MKNLWLPVAILVTLFVTPTVSVASTPLESSIDAVTQDDEEDDALDDILSEDPTESDDTVKEEKEAVKEDRVDSTPGASSSALTPDLQSRKKRQPIKILQRKNFMKVGRFESSFHLGFVTNDPFINRYMIGASFAYHLTEVFGVEMTGTFSPDFGKGDWKPITNQLVLENKVSPDISKIIWSASGNFSFAPIYGKLAVGKKIIGFDIFGVFGMGVVGTQDDLEALQCEEDQKCVDSQKQSHPTTTMGGGFRVIFSKNFSVRLEGRSMIYIETIQSTTLEMKNNFILMGSATIFFPAMK